MYLILNIAQYNIFMIFLIVILTIFWKSYLCVKCIGKIQRNDNISTRFRNNFSFAKNTLSLFITRPKLTLWNISYHFFLFMVTSLSYKFQETGIPHNEYPVVCNKTPKLTDKWCIDIMFYFLALHIYSTIYNKSMNYYT